MESNSKACLQVLFSVAVDATNEGPDATVSWTRAQRQ